jgi:hypothetical protein
MIMRANIEVSISVFDAFASLSNCPPYSIR